MDDIYDYFHYSSSDDVTENYLTDENQNPFLKKMGKSYKSVLEITEN